MDTAKKFEPKTILLWQKVATHPEAQRILELFPSSRVKIISKQRISYSSNVSQGQALLKSKRTLMIGATSSYVKYFDGKPGTNILCHPYYKLVPLSNGCPYYCTYCYLAYVYRKFSPFVKININYDTMFKQIRKSLLHSDGKVSFNMGEMLDSLAFDHITNLTSMLVPFFSSFSNAYLMLLTKSNNIDNLLAVEPNENVVISWSLNNPNIIKTYEQGTASLDERLAAAKKCQDYGYRIRYRIDPGILYENWQAEYAELIHKALTFTKPENITLGMLRLLPGHFRLAIDAYGNRARKLYNNNFVKGASDRKLRYKPQQRIEFYKFVIDKIHRFNKNISISLCRETPDIWTALREHCEPQKCNCVIWKN